MNYIHSRNIDMPLILTVGIWSTALAYLLQMIFEVNAYASVYWLLLVVGVDVAHVYSSLYRTYFSSEGRKEYGRLLKIIPLAAFIFCIALAYFGGAFGFWRVLVYFAIFHFIRQQIGFLRIYNEGRDIFSEAVIYIITFSSVLIWHLSPEKAFQWFIKDDFFKINFGGITPYVIIGLHALSVGAFLFYLVRKFRRTSANLIVISTFSAWYLGIATTNSDFIFTVTNVLTHGLPYMALVWHTQKKEKSIFAELYLFFPMLVVFAFVEEGLWDSLIWREHAPYFSSYYFIPAATSSFGVALALAFLILPQMTHYILDGFIWKTKGRTRSWIKSAS